MSTRDSNFTVYFCLQNEYDIVGEPDMAQLKKGDTIQILRKGYYICDSPYDAANKKPCRLFNIPDGATKEKPTSLRATDTATKAAGDQVKSTTTTGASGPDVDQLVAKIVQQGEQVREIKANKSAPKVKRIELTRTTFYPSLLIRMMWLML